MLAEPMQRDRRWLDRRARERRLTDLGPATFLAGPNG
jgi:hypothetical protein